MGFEQQHVTLIQDNQLTIALAHNPINHGRTKHIDITHHFLRECVERKEITLVYCPTATMVADALTKGVPHEKFEFCRNGMGVEQNNL